MLKNFRVLLLSVSLLMAAVAMIALEKPAGGGPAVSAPPKTAVKEVKETVQGTEIVDSYRWLEDQNSPETRAWIDSENAYTDGILSKLPGREAIEKQVAAMIKVDTMTSPTVTNNRYFFSKRQANQDQSSFFVRKGLEGKDELLVDPLPMSPKHTVTVNLMNVTRDGSLVAYGLREGGADEVTPHLMDVDSHKDLADVFPKARYAGFAILNDKSGIYLGKVTPEGPRLFFHKIGTESANDTEIFGKGYGPETLINCSLTRDNHYLLISVAHGSSGDHTELYFQDLEKKGPIVTIVKDVHSGFNAQIAGDKMYVRTNWKAPNWRVMEADLNDPAIDKWREVVPESDVVLDGFSLVGGKLAVRYTKDVIPHVKLIEPSGKLVREVPAPTLGSISGLNGHWDSDEAFYSFNSFPVPPTIYRYDVATGKQTVWFTSKVPIDSAKYEVTQVWYPSKDGTKIPMFLAHAKNLKLNGKNPVLLTGYGGFNVSSLPGFSAFAAAWMANGGVYAEANMRGGGEFGEAWHHAGMLEKKQNVFDDFIAAAEWLIKNKYTTPERLAIRGGSNGGLLVGAALTQRPDLYAAVICSYPLLDMVRYQNFLVAKYWVPEYGSSDDPAQFKYIYAYSPYHHVKTGTNYPSVLFISGDSDTRVAPLHARKMTALMQAATVGSTHPILLHYDTAAGHSGGTPAGKQIENTTDELDYLFWRLGVSTAQSQANEQAAAPSGDDLSTVLAMMNKSSANFKSAQGDFESINYQKLVDDKFTQQGHIYFRRAKDGVDAAFEIEGSAPKQVVYQKGVLRVYEKKIGQITERHVEKNKADVDAFLSLGFGASGNDLVRDYSVKMLGWQTLDGVKTAKLELAPKNETIHKTYPNILIWIDPEKDVLLQQQFFENSGDYRLVHYTKMKLNEKIGDDKFQLKTTGKVTTVQAQ